MRLRIDAETRKRFFGLFRALIAYVRGNPGVSRAGLVEVGAASGVASAQTIDEWIDRTAGALYEGGVIPAPEFQRVIDHFLVIEDRFVDRLGAQVIDYAESHPLTWMLEAERARLAAEIAQWEAEPETVPNIERDQALERLRGELAALGG